MPTLTGSIGPWGPTIGIKVMQTTQRVEALRKAGQQFSSLRRRRAPGKSNQVAASMMR